LSEVEPTGSVVLLARYPATKCGEIMSDYNIDAIRSLPGQVTISQHLPLSTIKNNIQTWLKKWIEYWPEELTIDILVNNLQCVYIPYWILFATASGNWSASIGKERFHYEVCGSCKGKRGTYATVWHDCTTCSGKGQVKKSYTEWLSQSGIATGSLNGKVYQNTAHELNLRCGKRDYEAEECTLEPPFSSDILVFQMKNKGESKGKQIADNFVRDEVYNDAQQIAPSLGRVKDLRISNISVGETSVRTWLYPIFLGSYNYENKLHLIEIDGITGKHYISVPESVRKKRTRKVMKVAGIIVVIASVMMMFVGVVLAVVYGIWWLGTFYFMWW